MGEVFGNYFHANVLCAKDDVHLCKKLCFGYAHIQRNIWMDSGMHNLIIV